jgi:hypothetical protein
MTWNIDLYTIRRLFSLRSGRWPFKRNPNTSRPSSFAVVGICCWAFLHACVPANGQTGTLLAYEPFDAPAGALLGANSGSGWAAAWDVQNQSTAVPGFNIGSGTPLTLSGFTTVGNYAVGGLQFLTAGRHFNTDPNGTFADYLSNGLIGKSGQTLWFSALARKDGSSRDDFSLVLHGGSTPTWVSVPGIEVGYYGGNSETNGTRYWSMRLDGTAYKTSVPIQQGQAALLVVKIVFGASSSTVSLYVNPASGATPSSADAQATTTNPIAFQSFAYVSGWDSNDDAIDELRVGTSYAAVRTATAVPPASPTGLSVTQNGTQVTLSWTKISGVTSYSVQSSLNGAAFQQIATTTTNSITLTNLTAGGAYQFRVVASNSGGSSQPSSAVVAFPRTVSAPMPGLGSNLIAISDWTREWPFVDIFKLARPWIAQQTGMSWGQGGTLSLTPEGWIASLQPGQYAETIIYDNALDETDGSFPTGNYILLYDGEGEIGFDFNSGVIQSQSPGRLVVSVASTHLGIYLKELSTNPQNPLRNIRLIMPGFESTYSSQPFHPTFLARLQGMKALRFMEWELTNNSALENWADRPQVSDYTYSWRGVPLEVMIDLANTLHVSPWFNIPHKASDDFVQKFAGLVFQRLDTNLKPYIEYSNETWNGMFSQSGYVQSQGQSLGLSQDPTQAGAYFTSKRSVQIFGMWQQAFGNTDRLIRVLPSQTGNSWMSTQIVEFQNAYGYADALAIAPYFSNCSDQSTGGWGFLGDPSTASQVSQMSVDQVLDIELEHIRNCSLQAMTDAAQVASQHGLKLVAYEGGQHLLGIGSAQSNAALIQLFKAANRSSRMEALYGEYLQNWKSVGGDLFMHYVDVTPYTQYGNFGSLEYQDQDPTSAPKYRALQTFIQQNP